MSIKKIMDFLNFLDVYDSRINRIYSEFKVKREKSVSKLLKNLKKGNYNSMQGEELNEEQEIKKIIEILHSRNVLTKNRIEIEILF